MSDLFSTTTHEKVLLIIRGIRETSPMQEKIFTNGSCYQLFKFLQIFFPFAECYCNSHKSDDVHVIVKIEDRFYDITGEISKKQAKNYEVISNSMEADLIHNHACLFNGSIQAFSLADWRGECNVWWKQQIKGEPKTLKAMAKKKK